MSKVRWSQVWFCALALAACGGDEKEPAEPTPETPDAGAGDVDGVSSRGQPTMRCGGERCELPLHLSTLDTSLCCLDMFTGGCGIMVGDQCQRISKRDSRCPAVTPQGMTGEEAELAGIYPCCASNDECGLDVGGGLGCLSTSQACSIYPREFVELLGSRTCDGKELEVSDECGIRP